jgi:hypothetical protein
MRVSFFVWTAALGKILTVDNLRKRGVLVVGWCCMCKRNGESVDHLLLHCDVARELWSAIFSLFGVTWVMPETVLDMLVCWRGQMGNRSVLPVWRIAPLCVLWIVWRERNARCFEDSEKSMIELLNFMLHSLFVWTGAFHISLLPSFSHFADFCISFSL